MEILISNIPLSLFALNLQSTYKKSSQFVTVEYREKNSVQSQKPNITSSCLVCRWNLFGYRVKTIPNYSFSTSQNTKKKEKDYSCLTFICRIVNWGLIGENNGIFKILYKSLFMPDILWIAALTIDTRGLGQHRFEKHSNPDRCCFSHV